MVTYTLICDVPHCDVPRCIVSVSVSQIGDLAAKSARNVMLAQAERDGWLLDRGEGGDRCPEHAR